MCSSPCTVEARFLFKIWKPADPMFLMRNKQDNATDVTNATNMTTSMANVTTSEANLTIHDHAAAAQQSAAEALHHLEQAQKSYNMTKTNVKEILKTGKKIKGTASDIKTLYTPPGKPHSGTCPSSVPAILALSFAILLGASIRSNC